MPTTVTAAFNRFSLHVVDLPADVMRSARSKRDYLIERLMALAKKDSDFAFLRASCVPYGSFARRTKIMPLDDIDIMMVLSGHGVRESVTRTAPITHRVKVEGMKTPLALFANDAGCVNSILVLNRIKAAIRSLHHYKSAAVKRNHQAVTVSVPSHDWTFDLVPAVPVPTPKGQARHFLIPDGTGQWMRTDPRKDAYMVTKTNSAHGKQLLPVIRLLKFWNRRTSKPVLKSFYLEVLVLRVFEGGTPVMRAPEAVAQFFRDCPALLRHMCPSPTGLGTALDADVSRETKRKVIAAMQEAENLAREALRHELKGDHAQAITCWRKVFGERFPSYG